MGNSNETMFEKNSVLQTLNALISAGKYSAIFFPIFTLYIFGSMLMAGVEGATSSVVNLTGELIAFPEKLLNSSGGAYALQACIFWTLILYYILFLISLCLNIGKKNNSNDLNKTKISAFLSLLFFTSFLLILVMWR